MITPPLTLPELDTATLAELRQRYEETSNAGSRTRYQMVLLAQQEYRVPQIALIVLRSEDTVARVLNRFLAGGLNAVPRRTQPGRQRTNYVSLGSREARASLSWIPHASRTGYSQLDH